MEKIKYDTIPQDALISIEISGSFYQKLTGLLFHLGSSVSNEEFAKVIANIKEDKPVESVFQLNIEIILALIYEVETNAKKQNKIKVAEFDPSTVPSEDKTT